jgi:hypothetical protein
MGDASFPVFFIVSGVVMLAGYRGEALRVLTLQWARVFWKKRLVRIAPLYYMSNLLLVPLYVAMEASVDYTGVLLSVFFLQCWTINPALNGISWVAGTFVFLYLMTPLILVPCVKIVHTSTCLVGLLLLQGILYGGVFWYGAAFTPQLHLLARSCPLVRLPLYMSGIVLGETCHHSFASEQLTLTRRSCGLMADICITLYIAGTVTVAYLTSVYTVPTDSVQGVSYGLVIRAVMEMASPLLLVPIIHALVIDETAGVTGGVATSKYGVLFRSNVMRNIGYMSSTIYMLQCVTPGLASLVLGLDWIGYTGVPIGAQLPLWTSIVSFVGYIAVAFLSRWLFAYAGGLLTDPPSSASSAISSSSPISPISPISPSSPSSPSSPGSPSSPAQADGIDVPIRALKATHANPLAHTVEMEKALALTYIRYSRTV